MVFPTDGFDVTRSVGTAVGTTTAVIGPYRLLQKLGEGGMGEVWLAEQTQPVKRHVAVKVIKPGMDSRAVINRFEAERQALALMDHPAIAAVFDGGTTPEGRPFFAMEFVKGETILEYCDRVRLSTEARLELFIQVCEGVQHAHQKGIIHRDLKPSNILVTLKDDKPHPKIIDFGIAKATGSALTDKTVFTGLGVMIGTPAYMSPEQADGGFDIDTRADIYALGVILYELLTGVLPVDRQEFQQAGLTEIQRIIREKEPPRPSTRVTQPGPESDQAAARRQTEPRRLASLLRGDLDWITMKALEKDRARRYSAVSTLVLDIRRHLNDEPVSAGPPDAAYKAKKFVRRHRFGVGMAAAAAMVLVVVAITMALQARRVARERDRANQEAAAAQQVTDFLVGLFKVSDPSESLGNRVTARQILDQGAGKIERELASQPEVQGRLMTTMGVVYRSLGLFQQSAELFQKSVDVRKQRYGPGHPEVATSLHELGYSLLRTGNLTAAESSLKEALALRERVHGPASAKVAETLAGLAELQYLRGAYDRAEPLYRRRLDVLRALGPGHDVPLANALNDLAIAVQARNDYASAKSLLSESLAIRRRVHAAGHPEIAQSLNNLAMAHYREREFDQAEPLFRESVALNRRVFGSEHPEVAITLNNLALVLRDKGDYAAANALFAEVHDMDRKFLGAAHPAVSLVLENWADSLRRAGDAASSETKLRLALDVKTHAFPADSWQVATTRSLLVSSLIDQRRYAEAEAMLLAAYPSITKQFGASHPRTRRTAERGVALYEAWGKTQPAAEWKEKAAAK